MPGRKESYLILPPWACIKYAAKELLTSTKKLDLKEIGQRKGDVVVVTGGNRGIGADVVKKLLQCDFHVVLGVRNIEAGEQLVKNVRATGIESGTTDILNLDLCSLDSVRNFGNSVLEKYSKIHILVLIAGIMATPFVLTRDGYESQFQVNYLSHFLLTNILMARIIDTSKDSERSGRIVNVSSIAHYKGQISRIFDLAARPRVYNRLGAYADSQLCQLTASNYLNYLLKNEEANVCCFSVHPGMIPTELSFLTRGLQCVKGILRTTDDGADVIVSAAASPKFEKMGGIYVMNCKVETPHPHSLDRKQQENLCYSSAVLLGIDKKSLFKEWKF